MQLIQFFFSYLFCRMETDTNDDNNDLLSIAENLCLASALLACRNNKILLHEIQFHIIYHMTVGSFNKILELLLTTLHLNERFGRLSNGEAISCKIMLHCTIRYLAGGSFLDIRQTASISKPSFYYVIWHTITTINNCSSLAVTLTIVAEGFKSKSTGQGTMNGCIGSVNGFLL